jgi:glycosyl-4,4'-diaponeurosporenoate acyltransferase
MPFLELSSGWVVIANVAVWVVVFVVSGSLAAHLSDRALAADRWLLRSRRFERGGRVYERHLHIAAWKDRVPDAGTFSGGSSKRHLPATEGRGVERFALETRRAELAHWYPLAALPIFAVWNVPVGMVINVAFALAFNAPFIAIQRYNRLRAERILARRASRAARHTPGVERPRPEQGDGVHTRVEPR